MSFIRRISALAAPIPQLVPPGQRVPRVPNACPEHSTCSMRRVHVLGRELWECSHPSHITGEIPVQQPTTGGLLISPIRARALSALSRANVVPSVPAVVYALPEPAPRQSTGAMQPVVPSPVPAEREAPCAKRPVWLQDVIAYARGTVCVEHPSLQDITPEDCEPDLSDDEDDQNATVVENKALHQLRLLARKKDE